MVAAQVLCFVHGDRVHFHPITSTASRKLARSGHLDRWPSQRVKTFLGIFFLGSRGRADHPSHSTATSTVQYNSHGPVYNSVVETTNKYIFDRLLCI